MASPELVAFYEDHRDDQGTAVGFRRFAAGLRFADGSALSLTLDGPAGVTMWPSVDAAIQQLDAGVDTLEPLRRLDAASLASRRTGHTTRRWDGMPSVPAQSSIAHGADRDAGAGVHACPRLMALEGLVEGSKAYVAWVLRRADGPVAAASLALPVAATLFADLDAERDHFDAIDVDESPYRHLPIDDSQAAAYRRVER